jgi:hypothetical protein
MTWIANHFSKNRYYFRAGRMFWFREIPGIISMRYENLETELNTILSLCGLPTVTLPEVGVSEERQIEVPVVQGSDMGMEDPRKDGVGMELLAEKRRRHYSTYYDADTRHFVEWCFLHEINELGYQFEEVPPWKPRERP